MPVRKFESLEACDESAWRSPDDPDLWKVISGIWRFSMRVAPQRFVPGVHKLCCIEDVSKEGLIRPVCEVHSGSPDPLTEPRT